MKFTIYQGSRQGPRPYNQDRLAYSYTKDALLMVMADGMGGHRHGEVAAQLAVRILTDAFQLAATPKLGNPARFLNEQILEIHASIDELRRQHGLDEAPRTTIAAVVVQGNKVYTAHVGDSRVYHFRDRKLLFRTTDHSVVQMMLRKGQIQESDLLTHPERHKIFNCLGGTMPPQVELSPRRDIEDGDTLMLCTDGLWTVMPDQKIALALHFGPVNESAPKLLDNAEALCRLDGDNMSLIAMQWGDLAHAVSTGTMPLGATTTVLNPPTYQLASKDEAAPADLTDAEIENAIADIRAAIQKTKPDHQA